MEKTDNIKALYIIVNAGFADEVVEIVRGAGAKGATIMNARGTGAIHKAIMGITVDVEKEIILSLVDGDMASKIILAVTEKAGSKSPANGICFVMPVEKMIAVNKIIPKADKQG